jgi:hypothetical protein
MLLVFVSALAIVGAFTMGRAILGRARRLVIRNPDANQPEQTDHTSIQPDNERRTANRNRHPEHPDIWWIDDRGRQRQVWLTENWARSGDTNAAIRLMREGQLEIWISDNRKHPAEYLRRDLEFVLSERFYNAQIYRAILKAAPVLEFEEYAYYTKISHSRIERSDGELSGMRGYHTVWPAAADSLFEAMRSANDRDTHLHWDLKFSDGVPVFSSNSCPIG